MNCHVDKTAVLGDNCRLGNFCSINEDCILGDNVVIHNNVTLYPGTVIGDGTEIFEGAVIGRPPKTCGNLVHALAPSYGPTKIGANCVIGVNAVIYAECVLGDQVLIGDGACIREGNQLSDCVLIAMNCTLNHDSEFGTRSKVMDLTHITANSVIGDNVFVGVNVTTVNDNAMRISGKEVGKSAQIEMGDNSRIGSSAMILPNKKIGKDALVGACALVTHDVSDGVRVMGIPAKEK